MAKWINYKELKAEIAFADVLEHYGVSVKVKDGQAKGMCPLPTHQSDQSKRSLSVNLDRNIFQCFGCGAKGNVLEFIALMEGKDPKDKNQFHEVAVLARRKFLFKQQRETPASSKEPASGEPRVVVNAPLDFELQGLDPEHPWFAENGFESDTVKHFGAGYCKRGMMKGRIAIPLHDVDGQLIGYAGKLVDMSKVSDDCPEWLFPQPRERKGVVYQFDPSLILYNADRVRRSSDDEGERLIVVYDILDVWWLWQHDICSAVGMLKSDFTSAQSTVMAKVREKLHLGR